MLSSLFVCALFLEYAFCKPLYLNTTSQTATTASTSTRNIAEYIALGIDVTQQSPTSSATQRTSTNAISQTGFPTSTTLRPVSSSAAVLKATTGSGSVYASSCASLLWNWHANWQNWSSSNAVSAYESTSYEILLLSSPLYSTGPAATPTFNLTTLCDGFARAIGSATPAPQAFSTGAQSFPTVQVISTLPSGDIYPTPTPCSISPSDCSALWSSFNSLVSGPQGSVTYSLLEPPCTTATTQSTIPFVTNSCYSAGEAGSIYDEGFVVTAATARLLYWPVIPGDQSSYFCEAPDTNLAGQKTVPPFYGGTPTGVGPNTAVIGSVTITSPDIGYYLETLRRVDGCGPTITKTVLVLPSESVSTARGSMAHFGAYPMNYADLNWKCKPSTGSGDYVLAITSESNDCYQDVAAQAYWEAQQNFYEFEGASNTHTLTIYNNYRPKIAPPRNFSSEMVQSLWGSFAYWWVDGIWDPPTALSTATTVASFTLPTAAASTTKSSATLTAPALPGQTTTAVASVTAGSGLKSSNAASSTALESFSSIPVQTALSLSVAASSSSADPTKPSDPPAQPDSASSSGTSRANSVASSAVAESSLSKGVAGSSTISLTLQTSTIGDLPLSSAVVSGYLVPSNNAAQTPSIHGELTLTSVAASSQGNLVVSADGSLRTIQIVTQSVIPSSAASSVDPGTVFVLPSGSTQNIVVGSTTLPVQSISSGIAIGSVSLVVGSQATVLAGETVSAASSGLVVLGGGATVTTSGPLSTAASTPASSAALPLIISNAGSYLEVGTQTLSVGGPAVTISGQLVSAEASALVFGNGTELVTLPVTAPARTTISATVLTFGSERLTASLGSDGVEVLYNSQTTIAITLDEAAGTTSVTMPTYTTSSVAPTSTRSSAPIHLQPLMLLNAAVLFTAFMILFVL